MINTLKTYWTYKKFQHFTFTHLFLIIGVLTIPVDIWYLYDLLIFRLISYPVSSVILHMYFNHNYVIFRNAFFKAISLAYVTLNSFWKFTDVKSYHIMHHKYWLTEQDPTSKEIQQGYWKYYIGVTSPTAIHLIDFKNDSMVNWFNRYFYAIKIALTLILILLLGWKLFVHLVIIQQFLVYLSLKAQDCVFHSNNNAKDSSWLYIVYGPDAWHIDHHTNYEQIIKWRFKYTDPQYLFAKLLCKTSQV
jgi:fatty-acid desaturase